MAEAERALLAPVRAEQGEAFSAARFEWAVSLVLSRSFAIALSDEPTLVILPLVDLFNHVRAPPARCPTCAPRPPAAPPERPARPLPPARSPSARTTLPGARADGRLRAALQVSLPGTSSAVSLDASAQAFLVRAIRASAAGEEVFITYGAKGSAELLACYGFALEPNPAHVAALSFGVPPDDPLAMHKRAMLPRALALALDAPFEQDVSWAEAEGHGEQGGRGGVEVSEELMMLLRLCKVPRRAFGLALSRPGGGKLGLTGGGGRGGRSSRTT